MRKFIDHKLGFLVLMVGLGACEQLGSGGGKEPELREPSSNKLVQVSRTRTISGTFDCEGATYRWTGSGNCSQREGMPPIFVLRSGARLRNCFIEGAPDGIHIRGSNVKIENVVMPDVCENAISANGGGRYDNIEIRNSQFANCEDKCLQFNPNSVRDVLIENNDFIKGASCIRFKRGASLTVRGNTFYDCRHAMRHSEGGTQLRVEDNKFISVERKLRHTSGLDVDGDL